MTKFLFEILNEEIPADLQKSGANSLYELFKKYAEESGISIENHEIFYSSQRIAIRCDLKIEKKEIITYVRGPRIGIDEKILQAFLSSQKNSNYKKIELENKYHGLEYQEILNENEEKIKENLAKICLKILQNFDWQDGTMLWRSYLPQWIRPIRSILCLLDEKIINFEFAGIKSSNKTHGHKMLARWKEITINNCEEYGEKLKENFVIVDPEARKKLIIKNIKNVDFSDKNIENLIKELSCIAEFPQVIELEIEDKFLSLPDDLIKYIMISHQRYIPKFQENAKYDFHKNKLSNQYYVIIDHNNPNSTMENGYKRVLNARLSDGKFYWDRFLNADLDTLIENLKTTRSEYIPEISIDDLDHVVNEELSIILEKISQTFANSQEIHKILNILSCDLSSELITEYPALRGLMAHEYIIKNKISLPTEYFQGISNNNLYYGESELYEKFISPLNEREKMIIFIKNMLKAEYFVVEKKEKPTSSRDPFQIRKSIELVSKFFIDDFFNKDTTQNSSEHKMINDENFKNIFLDVLLNFYYKISDSEHYIADEKIIEIGFHHFAENNQLIFNYFEVKKFIFAQLTLIQNLCNFKWKDETFQAYKRISQLCNKKYKDFHGAIDENLATIKEEKDFINLINNCKNELNFEKLQNVDFQNQISFTINNFFDKIRIEDEDKQIKNNRIAILSTFYNLIENFAPISKLK